MSDIATANEQMSIMDACSLVGMPIVEPGRKLFCPFGDFHADGGMSPAFRIYPDTNSCYCFACAQAWRPVSLLANARDLRPEEAAALVLETVGYVPVSVDDRIQALLTAGEPEIDTDGLAAALDTYCGRICAEWSEVQLEDRPGEMFARCLQTLESVRSPADATRWLEVVKRVMRGVLTRDTPEWDA